MVMCKSCVVNLISNVNGIKLNNFDGFLFSQVSYSYTLDIHTFY